MSNQDGMSEEFELLDVSHDVLSMSDTETSDGYENDLRTAAAIIEALEDAPHGSLQGFDLGSIPRFVGGLYGTSPPAAGQTFTVDLGTSPVSSSGASNAQGPVPAAIVPEAQPEQPAAATAEVSPTAQVVSRDTGSEDGTAAVKEPDTEPEADSTPDADCTEAPDASIDRAPALNSAVLVCLLSAAALATVLLLLSAAAGSYHPIDSRGHAYVTAPPRLHQSTFRSTLTSPYSYDVYARMEQTSMLTGMATAAAASGLTASQPAAAANAVGVDAGAGDLGRPAGQGLPWWLAFNSTSAGRRHTQGRYMKLASLPPSLQLVAEGSARADMSPSQRLRLHLWLLHCAARDNAQQQTQPKVSGSATTTPYIPFQPFASVKRARLASPIPLGLQCAVSETAHGWLSGFRQTPPQNPTQPAASRDAAQPPSGTNHTDPAISAVDTLLRFITPFGASSSSSSGGRRHPGRSSCSNSGSFAAAALRCSHQPAGNTPDLITARHSAAAADLPAPSPYHSHRSSDPSTAASHTHTVERRIAPPTKPVPPLYRPPLPCLLLGGRLPNRTAFRPLSTAQHSTTSSPRSRACTWPNVTTRHHQGSVARAAGTRGAKPYGRALAISLIRWGFHQQAVGGAVGAAVTLPMLPPVRQARPVANGTGSSSTTSSGHRKEQSEGAAVQSPLTLPMLPPVCEPPVPASVQQQEVKPQQAQLDTPFTSTISSTTSSSSNGQFSGLTLPMLPPIDAAEDGMHCMNPRPLLPPGPSDSHSTAVHTPQSSSNAAPARQAAAVVASVAEVLTTEACTHCNQQPSSSSSCSSIIPVQQQQEGQESWQQLLSSSSTTPEGSTETCSAGGNTSQGFILFHSLVPPTAAAAAAESAAVTTKRAQEFSRQRGDAADSVAVIKQQLDITWQYDYSDYETCYKYAAGAPMTADDLYVEQQQYHFYETDVDADNENDVICVDDLEHLEVTLPVSCSAVSLMAGGASSSCTRVMAAQAGAAAVPLPPAASKPIAVAAAIPLPPVEVAAAAAAIPLPPVVAAAAAAAAAIPLPPVQAATAAVATAIPLPPVQSSAAAAASNDVDLAAPAAAAKAAAAHKCINNATWACAVTAAAQLAATADVQQPPLALAGPGVKQAAARKAVNATDAACRAFKLVAGFPSADMAAVVPHSGEDTGATAWVASLVTLPMLPPTNSETKEAAAAARESRPRRDVGGTQLSIVDSTAGLLSFFGPRLSCDVIDMSCDRRRQPLWPGQAI